MDDISEIRNNNTETPEENQSHLTPIEIQQQYFENLGDTDWIKYEKCDRKYLLRNIAFALYGGPTIEKELKDLNCQDIELQGYTLRQKQRATAVFNKLCEQAKYSPNNEDIIVSILLVICVRPKPLKFYQIEPSGYWVDLHDKSDTDMWYTAVFSIRKCVPTTVGAKACRIYIDDEARVYTSWKMYLENNTQPKCVLVVPKDGYYKGEIVEKTEFLVLLSVVPSPALGLKSRVLSSADKVNTALSLGAIGVFGAAMFTPVAPVALVGVAAVSAATGVYGLVRSSLHLHDRRTHEQSIGVNDSEARGSWINVAASSVGLAGGAASGLLARSAAAGTNLTTLGQVLAKSVNVLTHANIVAGGAGLVNGLHHAITKYRDYNEAPTALEVFQLSSSALFFCHAAFSPNTAQDIVENAQAESINKFRDSLRSNKHRKVFDKVSAETRRIQGMVKGNTEVINGIKNIADKDQFFASLKSMNKQFNAHRLRISMTADGQVNINSQYRFNPSDLSNLGPDGRAQIFSNMAEIPRGPPNVPTRLLTSNGVTTTESENRETIIINVRPEEILRIGIHLIRLTSTGTNKIAEMLENLSQELHAQVMTISFNLLSNLFPADVKKLQLFDPDGDLTEQIVRFVFNHLNRNRPLGEPCYDTDSFFGLAVKEFFQDGIIKRDTILVLMEKFKIWLDERIDRFNREFPDRLHRICPECEGVTYA